MRRKKEFYKQKGTVGQNGKGEYHCSQLYCGCSSTAEKFAEWTKKEDGDVWKRSLFLRTSCHQPDVWKWSSSLQSYAWKLWDFQEISDKFDSQEVLSNNSQGVIHMVKRLSQMLPYCVIQLKKQSLSSPYIKPAHCVQPNQPNTQTQCLKLNSSPQLSAQGKPTQTADQEGWSMEFITRPSYMIMVMAMATQIFVSECCDNC